MENKKERFIINVEHLTNGLVEVRVRESYSDIILVRRTYADRVNVLINSLMNKIASYNSARY